MNILQELLNSSGLARVSREIEIVAMPSIRLRPRPTDETRP